MKVLIHEEAHIELRDSIEWYNRQKNGLGDQFKFTVIKQIRRIKKNPQWYLKEVAEIYKAYVPRFPFKILFTVKEDKIIIWAIAHHRRKPEYWQSRE